jgi:protoporphyrinogen oxidase
MQSNGPRTKIAVIGGGLMGLALAHRLTAQHHQVTVLERERQLGGLTTYHDYGRFFWDRFYHVILPTDRHLLGLIEEIGLGYKMRWSRTLTGFFVDGQFHSMSSGIEFLRFRPLSLWGKFRLALTILYCSRIENWRRLEKIRVTDWLTKLSGRATYEKIWKPLLLAKLGEDHARVSAVFIWSYIKRMFSARERSTQKEHLGHVSGGYKTIFDRLETLIKTGGGRIRTGTAVQRIAPRREGGLWIEHDGEREWFDKVIFTSPVDALQRVADDRLLRLEQRGQRVEYLGVICMVLVTREPLVPYYIVNIADQRVPFTGIIGMSNLVQIGETANLHVTFLPKYVPADSPLFEQSDDDLQSVFLAGLRTMLPNWERCGLESVHINRARRVQPLQVLNYSNLVPRVASEHPDFFVLNTSQFTHMTLNNNEVVRAVDEFLVRHAAALVAPAHEADLCPAPSFGANAEAA